MSISIDVPFGLSDLDKIFKVSDLLENRETLINEFKPEVTKFLVKKEFFKGPFLREYNKQFNHLVQTLIRKQFVKHFPDFSPEEIVLLSDIEFLKMITSDFYFDQTNYMPKEGKNNDQQTH